MKITMKSVKAYAVAHKAVSTAVILVIALGGYGIYKHVSAGSTQTKYVLATIERQTLITSVSGTGQVAAANQVNVTSAVSGTIQQVLVSAGDAVVAGQALARIDSADASRAVNNAELSLENAKVSYDKAAKEAATQAADSTSSDLAKAYQAGYNAIVSASIDLPSVFSNLDDIYYSSSHSPYFSDLSLMTSVGTDATNYKLRSGADFDAARNEYAANFDRYKNISANSSPADIVSLLNETNVILQKALLALSGTYTTLDYIQDKVVKIPTELTSDKSTVSSAVNRINSDTSSITNALTSIDNAQSSGTTANLSMKSAELSVNQATAALQDAQKALADHSVKAPFDGIIAKVNAKALDNASNGTNIATLVTTNQIVNISLNEIDAAKVAKDEKVTLTFDAIDGLTLAGHVTNVDLVGTVSQGVVTYTVEIAFDDSDPRVKPGMTVNADIITSATQDALAVPSGAVKTAGGSSYVQVLAQTYSAAEGAAGVVSDTAPQAKLVTVGVSNDTMVQILSGLSEGDQVVSKTVTGTTAAKTSTTPSLLGGLGGRTGGAAAGTTVRATATFAR